MTFTGTLVHDLQSLVDAHLKLDCICSICGQHYKQHSAFGAQCPNSAAPFPRFLQSRFIAET